MKKMSNLLKKDSKTNNDKFIPTKDFDEDLTELIKSLPKEKVENFKNKWLLNDDVVESNSKDEKQKNMKEFREAGMLWFINTILHTFGWALVYEINKEKTIVYPKKVLYRGFSEKDNTEGYEKVTNYMKNNIESLQEAFKKEGE